jgi:FLVCR family feline leukemia virus subgroup C receptor-related protein
MGQSESKENNKSRIDIESISSIAPPDISTTNSDMPIFYVIFT